MKNKPLILFLLLILIGCAAYLDSPYSFLNKNYSYSYSASEPAIAQPLDDIVAAESPDVQEKLVQTQKVNGYIVETYREYDVYKDANGKITKEVPTSEYDELRYWDYNGSSPNSGQ